MTPKPGCFLLLLPFAALADVKLPAAAKMQIDFNKHVQPILASKCYQCHGAKQQQSGLRLDKRQNALRGGDYGPVIIQFKSAESKLILRTVNGDGGMKMPPTGPLETEEIAILRAWIDQGADFGVADLKEEKPKPVDPKVTALIAAVKARDLRAIETMLRTNPGLAKGTDSGGSTALHHAAAFGTTTILEALLKAGADIEAANRFGQHPLHWAFDSVERTGLLLGKGAAIDSRAHDGRTALYLAASQRRSGDVLRLLLDKGANVELATTNGRTPLMAAAAGGLVPLIQMLLDRKANVNAASGTGSTALMDAAASRKPEAVRLLVNAGADVNAKTKRNNTALAAAAMYGLDDSVKLLLDKGADVNVRDERGYSPLMYAACSESMPAKTVKVLLERGAERNVTGEDETPVTLAGKRGDTEVARLLGVPAEVRRRGGVAEVKPNTEERTPSQAVQKALVVLARQSPVFLRKSGCNSCHNQYVPAAALAIAKDRGIPAPPEIAELPLELAEKYPERAIDMTVAAIGSVGYELLDAAARRSPANAYTDAVVHYVKAMQTPEGYWQTAGSRPPITSDDIITTAMAVNILRVYGPSNTAETGRAANWLESAAATTTQERAFQVLGLAWAKAPRASIDRALQSLIASQRADGGWAQLPQMASDAHATGQALYAMHEGAKLPVTAEAYRKGVRYLMSTQLADGSWHVRTRSLATQPYFESGFPHGRDQFISAHATAWAAMALSYTVDPVRMSLR